MWPSTTSSRCGSIPSVEPCKIYLMQVQLKIFTGGPPCTIIVAMMTPRVLYKPADSFDTLALSVNGPSNSENK